jgi:hypothetical protein
MAALTKFTSHHLIIARVRRAQLSNRNPHLRRHRSLARRQRRGLLDYRRFSMAYRSALENSRSRVATDPGVGS